MKFSLILLVGIFVASVSAQCPNHCSGHGTCGMYDKCKCYFGWTDGDCSNRLCREDKAWFDTPSAATDAHAEHAECSNRGICDRKTGDCKCFEGFEGTSCQRTVCPGNGDCSGHGTCEDLSEMATPATATGTGTSGSTYTNANWDYDKIVGCNCDFGYNGDACQNEMCSRGDDPLSPTTTKEKYTITLQNDATLADSTSATVSPSPFKNANHGGIASESGGVVPGGFEFEYYGRKVNIAFIAGDTSVAATNAANAATLSMRLKQAMESLDTIKQVTIEDLSYDVVGDQSAYDRGMTFTLTIDKLGSKLFRVDGNGGGMYFKPDGRLNMRCLTGGDGTALSTACVTAETVTVVKKGLYEHKECSGRGICDYTSGTCKCFSGFTSDACDVQSALVQ